MKLSALIDTVNTNDEEVIITKNGQPAAVLISPDEFEGWKETMTIQSDSELMSEIKKGLLKIREKKADLYTLDELFS